VVDSLSSLVHLQHLQVVPTLGYLQQYTLGGLSGATLPCLQHLTYLRAHSLSLENLVQLGSLFNLQTLYFHAGDEVVGPKSVPGLALPASLRKLVLLSPVEAGLLSQAPIELQVLQLHSEVEGPAEGPGTFLSCMAGLQHLTFLEVSLYVAWPLPGPAYSALTASSSLVHLDISHTCPEGMWQFIFPATRTLPHLTCLSLGDPDDENADPAALSPSWGVAELTSLVSCCPDLCELECLHLPCGLHGAELLKLTALTRLRVSYSPETYDFTTEESMRSLAAVTQLKDLQISPDTTQGFSYSSILPLTHLTALTSIQVDSKYAGGFEANSFQQVNKSLEHSGRQTVCTVAGVDACRMYGVLARPHPLWQGLLHSKSTPNNNTVSQYTLWMSGAPMSESAIHRIGVAFQLTVMLSTH
jgi:hypothetical protein